MDWIVHIRTNGNSALKEIYTLYRNECVDWLIKYYNLNEELAKDAFQLSMLILYQNVAKGKVEHSSSGLKTYLFGIAKNKARDLLKSESRYHKDGKIGMIKEDLTDGVAQKQRFEILMEKVQNAMSSMGDPCKSILKLFYFEKMKFQQMAPLFGHDNADITKNKKYKCLKKLSKMVSQHKNLLIEPS